MIKPTIGHLRQDPRKGCVSSVLLALSSRLFTRGLRDALHATNDIHVVAEAHDITDALHAVDLYRPEVCILDVELSGGGAAVLLRRLHQQGLSTSIIYVLQGNGNEHLMRVRDTARLFVTSLDSEEEMITAVRSASGGKTYVSDKARSILASLPSVSEVNESKEFELTATELQILTHLGHGRTSKQIADLLFISYRTVQKHRANIARKLGLRGSNALLAYALKRNATD
ncbi:MAG: response regulator transcription factor [Bacteroidia bacterium]|nr:response regulator transcription factor [Bacteroidia bacterium]